MESVLARPGTLVELEAAWGRELLRVGVRGAVPASSEESLGLFCLPATAKGSFLSSHLMTLASAPVGNTGGGSLAISFASRIETAMRVVETSMMKPPMMLKAPIVASTPHTSGPMALKSALGPDQQRAGSSLSCVKEESPNKVTIPNAQRISM